MKLAAARKFASGPTGSLMLTIKCKMFFIASTTTPATGPSVNVASKAGTSLISSVKYGGRNGNGTRIHMRIKPIALSMLIVMSRFVCFCIEYSTPFIHLTKNRRNDCNTKKPPSSPIQTILSALDSH